MAIRIGFYICHCGINIAYRVRVEEVAAFARQLPNVVVARDYKFMCSDPGQEMIENDIKVQGLNRVVVASCSPRLHEKTFQAAFFSRWPRCGSRSPGSPRMRTTPPARPRPWRRPPFSASTATMRWRPAR
ncbi:MAG: hypothetical protein MUC33_24285 [Desulfobacterales bacterium]|nr:hypothetical protein [Desulfobacterales bacterium]